MTAKRGLSVVGSGALSEPGRGQGFTKAWWINDAGDQKKSPKTGAISDRIIT